MTKKDYELIAKAIKKATFKAAYYSYDTDILTEITNELAKSLKDDNPSFDKFRFFEACKLDK